MREDACPFFLNSEGNDDQIRSIIFRAEHFVHVASEFKNKTCACQRLNERRMSKEGGANHCGGVVTVS